MSPPIKIQYTMHLVSINLVLTSMMPALMAAWKATNPFSQKIEFLQVISSFIVSQGASGKEDTTTVMRPDSTSYGAKKKSVILQNVFKIYNRTVCGKAYWFGL